MAVKPWPKERLARCGSLGERGCMQEPPVNRDDVKLLFEVLFDIKALLATIVELIEGGDDDGLEEEEADET